MYRSPYRPYPLLMLVASTALLGGCVYRIHTSGPPGAYEDFGIERHFWNGRRLTVGPYEVRDIRVRYRGEDEKTVRRGPYRILRTTDGQTYRFKVSGPGAGNWQGTCDEDVVETRVDSLEGFGIHLGNREPENPPIGNQYAIGLWKEVTTFKCRFVGGTGKEADSLRLQPARSGMELVFGDSSRPSHPVTHGLRGMVGNRWHSMTCFFLGNPSEPWGILDQDYDRIYLETSADPRQKLQAVTILTALRLRHSMPGWHRHVGPSHPYTL